MYLNHLLAKICKRQLWLVITSLVLLGLCFFMFVFLCVDLGYCRLGLSVS